MKSLKILSLFFALFLIGVNTGFAQTSTANLTEEQKEELAKQVEEYFEALDLSEDQMAEFEAITKKYAEQMKAVKEGNGSKVQKAREIKSIGDSKNSEMKKLLSADQYKIYLEKQEEMKKKMKEYQNQN